MTYDEVQVFTQLLSLAIFAGLLVGAFVYAFKGSNKKMFEDAASTPLRNDDKQSDGD